MSHLQQRPGCRKKIHDERAKRRSALAVKPNASHSTSDPDLSGPMDDHRAPSPPREPAPPTKRRRVYVEEELDQDVTPGYRFSEKHPTAARTFGTEETSWEARRKEDEAEGIEPWWPFDSVEDWKLADWLMSCGISQKEMDKHLKLPTVRQSPLSFIISADVFPCFQTTDRVKPSFKNVRELLKKVDNLPAGPEFRCERFTVTGDLLDAENVPIKEETEMWYRDPLDCVQELLSNASFSRETAYAPERTYRVNEKKEKVREYGEMRNADWWWDKQVRLSAAFLPMSDSTHVSPSR